MEPPSLLTSCPPSLHPTDSHGGGGRRRCRIQTQAAADSECAPGPPLRRADLSRILPHLCPPTLRVPPAAGSMLPPRICLLPQSLPLTTGHLQKPSALSLCGPMLDFPPPVSVMTSTQSPIITRSAHASLVTTTGGEGSGPSPVPAASLQPCLGVHHDPSTSAPASAPTPSSRPLASLIHHRHCSRGTILEPSFQTPTPWKAPSCPDGEVLTPR